MLRQGCQRLKVGKREREYFQINVGSTSFFPFRYPITKYVWPPINAFSLIQFFTLQFFDYQNVHFIFFFQLIASNHSQRPTLDALKWNHAVLKIHNKESSSSSPPPTLLKCFIVVEN